MDVRLHGGFGRHNIIIPITRSNDPFRDGLCWGMGLEGGVMGVIRQVFLASWPLDVQCERERDAVNYGSVLQCCSHRVWHALLTVERAVV